MTSITIEPFDYSKSEQLVYDYKQKKIDYANQKKQELYPNAPTLPQKPEDSDVRFAAKAFAKIRVDGELRSLLRFAALNADGDFSRTLLEQHDGYKDEITEDELINVENKIIDYSTQVAKDLSLSYIEYHRVNNGKTSHLDNSYSYWESAGGLVRVYVIPVEKSGIEFRVDKYSGPPIKRLESTLSDKVGLDFGVSFHNKGERQLAVVLPYDNNHILKFVENSQEFEQLKNDVSEVLLQYGTNFGYNIIDSGSLVYKTREGEPEITDSDVLEVMGDNL